MRVIQLRTPEQLFIGILYNPDSKSPYRTLVDDPREMFAFLQKKYLLTTPTCQIRSGTYQSADSYEQEELSFMEDR